ncbi:hypothetical protein Q1695_010728 [Nippostrongylus brasiliensis]|nr:hypothetical protein Q1695_010728 [Nippostrongylus brasiliensis]
MRERDARATRSIGCLKPERSSRTNTDQYSSNSHGAGVSSTMATNIAKRRRCYTRVRSIDLSSTGDRSFNVCGIGGSPRNSKSRFQELETDNLILG